VSGFHRPIVHATDEIEGSWLVLDDRVRFTARLSSKHDLLSTETIVFHASERTARLTLPSAP